MLLALILIIVAGILHVLAALAVPSPKVGLSELAWAFFTFGIAAFWYGGVR